MNPLGLVLIIAGIVIMVLGFRGSYQNFIGTQ